MPAAIVTAQLPRCRRHKTVPEFLFEKIKSGSTRHRRRDAHHIGAFAGQFDQLPDTFV
jgi:hypothetical protein